MNVLSPWLLVFLLIAVGTGYAEAKELSELKILYVGDKRGYAGDERANEFVSFLQPLAAKVASEDREVFRPDDAAPFDVVVLDWPQDGARDFPPKESPLGPRAGWNKPTVLLGSAGLKLAIAWKLKGGGGCTCLQPLAFGLRSHEIFDSPYKINLSAEVSIPTPPDFQAEIKDPTIKVLPLVDDYQKNRRMGWCSYAYDFPKNPDVEYFCGGVNEKTPTAAGLWRQGNLLHFGFQQSPAEMNETGRDLLLNSIVYISRFSQDRPIAVTPSVFAGPVAPSRGAILRRLRNPDFYIEWVAKDIAPGLWAKIAPPDAATLAATAKSAMDQTPFVMPQAERDKMVAWFEQNGKFLHPGSDLRLDLDPDLVALGVPFDDPTFIDRAIGDLDVGGPNADRARRLLSRYVPCGPKHGAASEWIAWWKQNKPYAFSSDSGDYIWYIDPLAKSRGIPSIELRGPKRADAIAGDQRYIPGAFDLLSKDKIFGSKTIEVTISK